MSNSDVRLGDMLSGAGSSIRECLTVLDKHDVSAVFIVDDGGRLVGVVGEREVRKALVDGAHPDDPVRDLVGEPPTTATPSQGRAEVLDMMRALKVGEVPIVDGDGCVVGVHVESEIVGALPLANWAVVMAGGRGTRLAPLTDKVPKPMLPVAGRPILERIVLHLVGSGIRRIFMSVNYLGDLIVQYFGDGSSYGCSIEYLWEREDRPLGTGGALRLLHEQAEPPTAPVVLMNGDLLTEFSMSAMLAAHAQRNVVATIATSQYQHQVPFGVLEADDGQLRRIIEKPTSSWPVNAGVYALEPHLLARVPRGELFPVTRLFDDCLARGERVGLWPIDDLWQDIGRPNELASARGQA
ncbi:nucleotidyltransferase family protein [Phytoactinopolyspora endophytica]|uniref:nucleotidyltransferase family protein n=1 Tax=Phytoactinopolyspora endophytica TaxID=1642495 RepID=UPI00101BA6C3|nr:nucleotidyltransferase family protein [Phytoactinopolyspora endophytica]